MANKYAAGNYMNSGMSKSAYEATMGNKDIGSTSLEKQNTTTFNPSAYGSAFEQAYNSASASTQSAMSVLGTTLTSMAQKSEPLPVSLSSKDIKDLWKKAENDSTISSYYSDQIATGKTDFTNTVTAMETQDTANLQQLSQQQTTDLKNLQEQYASQGAAQSGFKNQAQTNLQNTQSGVITSTRSQMQQQLQSAASAYEQTYGTAALQAAGIPSVAGVTASPSGVAIQGVSANLYGTTLAGTLATQKTTDIQNQFNELEQEELQQKGGTSS
jgi:hypothetical protein